MEKEDMSIEKEMMEACIEEIKMAEKYIHIAEMCDPATAIKLQEMAKDEMRHYDTAKQILDSRIATKSNGDSIKAHLYEHVYNDWISHVRDKVNGFKAK